MDSNIEIVNVSSNASKKKEMNNDEEKKRLTLLIQKQDESLKLAKAAGSSDVWNHFSRIEENDKQLDYVCCNNCKSVLHYKNTHGTSTLKKHSNRCFSSISRVQPSVVQFMQRKTIPKKEKAHIIKAISYMCAVDMRPFNIVEGVGFQKLAKKLIDFGAKNGSSFNNDLLPSARAVSINCENNYNKLLNSVIEHLSEVESIAITIDHWTHDSTKIKYLGLCAHYLKNKKIICRNLSTEEVENKQSITTMNQFDEIMEKFKLNDKLKVIVSDNAKDLSCAFRSYPHITCAAHNINLVLSHALDLKELETISLLVDIQQVIIRSKKLVQYAKQSGLNNKLAKTLKQQVETRWDSHVEMFESILYNWDKLFMMRQDIDYNLEMIDCGLIERLVKLLKPIKNLRLALSEEKRPTLHMVLVAKAELLDLCTTNPTDNAIMISLKERLKKFILSHFTVQIRHYAATLLNPRYKQLKNLATQEKRFEALLFIKQLLNEIDNNEPRSPIIKKQKSKYEDDDEIQIDSDELDSYLNEKRSNNDPDDLIEYWLMKSNKYPNLSKVALWLHIIPASSVSIERNFNYAGLTLTDNRSSLSSTKVNQCLFTRSNYDLFDDNYEPLFD